MRSRHAIWISDPSRDAGWCGAALADPPGGGRRATSPLQQGRRSFGTQARKLPDDVRVCGREVEREQPMRFIRMYLGGESGEPGLTLYEIDAFGWVHRQVQIHAGGSRFAPEEILMQRPVNPEYMATHPAADEIEESEFERLWSEIEGCRSFRDRLPDPGLSWEGWIAHNDGALRLLWQPNITPPTSLWRRVPGFNTLYCQGDELKLREIQRSLFLERPIHWCTAVPKAA